jgi:predicted RNA-binding protein with RPS1 domain
LNYYAGCDVFYLPKLYDLFCKKIETKKVQHITIQDIFNECQKYLNYLSMNKNIKNYNKMNITEGTKLKGLIKNFQNYCVFIQLNIGYIGIIDVFPSVQILKDKYHLGDIVDFTILKVDNKKKRMMLDLCENNEEKNEINLGVNNNEEFKLKLVDNKNNASNLVQGLNLNKESFFPKSYNRNNINSYNYFDNNAFNQYQYNNINYNNGYDYYNNNYNNNYYENYYNENDTKKDYNNKNYMINNELILNNNYNGLFYDYEGKYYYYNNDDDANNEDNKDENDNSYYYTLKPFPK